MMSAAIIKRALTFFCILLFLVEPLEVQGRSSWLRRQLSEKEERRVRPVRESPVRDSPEKMGMGGASSKGTENSSATSDMDGTYLDLSQKEGTALSRRPIDIPDAQLPQRNGSMIPQSIQNVSGLMLDVPPPRENTTDRPLDIPRPNFNGTATSIQDLEPQEKTLNGSLGFDFELMDMEDSTFDRPLDTPISNKSSLSVEIPLNKIPVVGDLSTIPRTFDLNWTEGNGGGRTFDIPRNGTAASDESLGPSSDSTSNGFDFEFMEMKNSSYGRPLDIPEVHSNPTSVEQPKNTSLVAGDNSMGLDLMSSEGHINFRPLDIPRPYFNGTATSIKDLDPQGNVSDASRGFDFELTETKDSLYGRPLDTPGLDATSTTTVEPLQNISSAAGDMPKNSREFDLMGSAETGGSRLFDIRQGNFNGSATSLEELVPNNDPQPNARNVSKDIVNSLLGIDVKPKDVNGSNYGRPLDVPKIDGNETNNGDTLGKSSIVTSPSSDNASDTALSGSKFVPSKDAPIPLRPDVCGSSLRDAEATCSSKPRCKMNSEEQDCYLECDAMDPNSCDNGKSCYPLVDGCLGFDTIPTNMGE